MDLHAYLRALLRFWWVVVIGAVLGAAVGLLIALTATPVYTGSVTFFATTPSAASSTPLQGDQFGQARVNTYVKLLDSDKLATRVLDKSGANLTASQISREISGSADLNTVLVTARIADPQRARARAILDAVADEFPTMIDEIESQNGTQRATVRLDVVSGPSLSAGAANQGTALRVAIGLLGGLLLGLAVALALGRLDRSVRGAEALRGPSRPPHLGSVPKDSDAKSRPVIAGSRAASSRAEGFRQLRTHLDFLDGETPASVVAVTSPRRAEGRSLTAANLALSYVEAGRNVVLVDADLRNPSLAGYLDLDDSRGLVSVLRGDASLEESLQRWEGQLSVLTSGPDTDHPAELLVGSRMGEVVAALRASFDVVVLDTAPLLPFTDAALVAKQADGAIVVVRNGRTRATALDQAVDSLHAVGAPVLGTVLNRVRGGKRG